MIEKTDTDQRGGTGGKDCRGCVYTSHFNHGFRPVVFRQGTVFVGSSFFFAAFVVTYTLRF